MALFESLEEWADYIAFLSKLQKVLQSYKEELDKEVKEGGGGGGEHEHLFFVPHATEVSYRLALCLSPTLPNGVHQKTLNIYEFILENLNS